MRLGTHLECIGSSPRVSGVCQDGAREFTGRRPGLTGRLSGKAEKLVRSWEGLEVRTMQWELTGSSLGVHRRNQEARWEHAGRSLEEDRKTRCKNTGGCRFGGSDDCTTQAGGCIARTLFSGCLQRCHRRLYRPYPIFLGVFEFWLQILKPTGAYKYPKFSCILHNNFGLEIL
ncbi:hypothetical protein BHE74_00044963 [Ensete ventricosum]|nr:hypothetical protein BHE74_00044963 [Ensete ventricosum]